MPRKKKINVADCLTPEPLYGRMTFADLGADEILNTFVNPSVYTNYSEAQAQEVLNSSRRAQEIWSYLNCIVTTGAEDDRHSFLSGFSEAS